MTSSSSQTTRQRSKFSNKHVHIDLMSGNPQSSPLVSPHKKNKTYPSWWFQPVWKILVKLEIIPNFRGENKKIFELPPPSIYSIYKVEPVREVKKRQKKIPRFQDFTWIPSWTWKFRLPSLSDPCENIDGIFHHTLRISWGIIIRSHFIKTANWDWTPKNGTAY